VLPRAVGQSDASHHLLKISTAEEQNNISHVQQNSRIKSFHKNVVKLNIEVYKLS
jgi:hypothetical protein